MLLCHVNRPDIASMIACAIALLDQPCCIFRPWHSANIICGALLMYSAD